MQKQRISLIIGIILALITVFMIKVYLDKQRRIILEDAKKKLEKIQTNQTAVLVAKKDIPRGSTIEPDSLEVNVIPNQFVQPQVATSLDRIAGMVTVAPISKGEQITLSKLMSSQQTEAGSLAMATPIGKRAITISVDNLSAVGGMIRPGDYVDVIGMIPVPVQTADGKQTTQMAIMPLFQNVLVLAVGQELGPRTREEAGRYKREEKREVSPLITLALAPQETNLIAFVQEQGKIRLVLRSPADSQIQPVQPASWDTLFQYVMPKELPTQELKEPKDESKETRYVEIYRGLNKERIPLSK